jgi:hypothetical protein
VEDPSLEMQRERIGALGLEVVPRKSGGGTDGNFFNAIAPHPNAVEAAFQRALDGGAELRHRVFRQIGAYPGIWASGAG